METPITQLQVGSVACCSGDVIVRCDVVLIGNPAGPVEGVAAIGTGAGPEEGQQVAAEA